MGWKLHVFDHYFHAKTHRECPNRSVYFCTDLSAKMGVSIDVYFWIEFDFDFWNQIFKISDFNAILNLCNHPDPKAPRLVVRQAAPVRGAENTGRGGRFSCPFYAISSVPDAFVKFLYQAAPWSLMRGLCWSHRFRPSCACVLPVVRDAGPLLEPLVPPLVRLRAALRRRPCPAGGAHDFQIFIIHTLYGS